MYTKAYIMKFAPVATKICRTITQRSAESQHGIEGSQIYNVTIVAFVRS
jgi:hypothetical protein